MGDFSIDDFLDIDLVTDRALAYRILGVEAGTDGEVLKKAYKGLAAKYHPDKVQQEPELLEKYERFFKLLSEAYSFLTNPRHKNGALSEPAPPPPPANFRDRFSRRAKERSDEVRAAKDEERKRWAKDPYGRGKATASEATTPRDIPFRKAASDEKMLTLDDLLNVVRAQAKRAARPKTYKTFYDKINGDYVEAQGLIELNWGDPLFGSEYEGAIKLIIGEEPSESSKKIDNKIAKIAQMDFKKERFVQALLYAENVLFDHPNLAFPFHSLDVAEEMAVAESLEQMLLAGTVAATVLRDHALNWPTLASTKEATNYANAFLDLYSALLPHCLREKNLSSLLPKHVVDRFYTEANESADDLDVHNPESKVYDPLYVANSVAKAVNA